MMAGVAFSSVSGSKKIVLVVIPLRTLVLDLYVLCAKGNLTVTYKKS